MSRRCMVNMQKGVMTGHNVSHSNRKTKRRFKPNLHNFTMLSDVLRTKVVLRATPSSIRTIEHNDGLDNYLLNTPNTRLTSDAIALKKKIKRALGRDKIV